MGIISSKEVLENGGFLNHWFESRLNHNKNVLIVVSGATGSSKTYDCLTTGENWYKYKFNETYPIDNICFSLGELAKRINNLHAMGKLRKGELFLLEEAGTNFGNLDFQDKLNKMFNYILQSFRSMNLIVLMTLPVLTMLNKGARQLIHAHFITAGIDYENGIAKVKPLFHQLSQNNGKSYWKYPRVKINGKIIKIHKLKFKLCSKELRDKYEAKKEKFVYGLTYDFVDEVEKRNDEKRNKSLTEVQQRVALLLLERNVEETSKIMNITLHCILTKY